MSTEGSQRVFTGGAIIMAVGSLAYLGWKHSEEVGSFLICAGERIKTMSPPSEVRAWLDRVLNAAAKTMRTEE